MIMEMLLIIMGDIIKWIYYLVLLIKAKYLTLKEELLNNKICWISIDQWNDIYNKSKYLLNIIKKYKYFISRKHSIAIF